MSDWDAEMPWVDGFRFSSYLHHGINGLVYRITARSNITPGRDWANFCLDRTSEPTADEKQRFINFCKGELSWYNAEAFMKMAKRLCRYE